MSGNRNSPLSRSEKLYDNLLSGNSKQQSTCSPEELSKKKSNEVIEDMESDFYKNEIERSPEENDSSVNKINISRCTVSSPRIAKETCISELCLNFQNEMNFASKCQSVLSLASACGSPLNEEDWKSMFDVLNMIPEHLECYSLSFCQALLLQALTKQALTPEQFITLENWIIKILDSVICQEYNLGDGFLEARIVLLGGERYLVAYNLCKQLISQENLDINLLDVSTVCCAALKSLSETKTISIRTSRFSDNTLKYIITMIGKSTQEIISENLTEEIDENISISSFAVSQCLQVLEKILSVDASSPCKTLDHEDYSLLRCLTKLLEWSISSLFPDQFSGDELFKVQNAVQAFHLSTLVSILKVFSILSFDPDQYDYYTNGKGSIEKIMTCILKIYFLSEGNHFDVLVLALELLINFSFKCKKAFALVCLKRFRINSSEEYVAIEALLKILNVNLSKINEIKSNKETQAETVDEDNITEDILNLALKAADEDMELSTIVSFIGILVMLFMDSKKSSFAFIQERLSVEQCAEAAIVSRKFLQFALITGEMPPTGVLLLRESINKFNQLHHSS